MSKEEDADDDEEEEEEEEEERGGGGSCALQYQRSWQVAAFVFCAAAYARASCFGLFRRVHYLKEAMHFKTRSDFNCDAIVIHNVNTLPNVLARGGKVPIRTLCLLCETWRSRVPCVSGICG